ncbi:MAG: serine/threonine-protein phosphatase [Bacteroidales bacterium]|nr:serine/threonine-protein phosphatase [Bacteroidales bacterium]
MELCLETGYTSLNHVGEELCGDHVESCVDGDYTTLVLADGLGSGVKASILSTLTSKILCTMVSNDIDIVECVSTIIETLPVCKVRGVAYSTFSVVHVNRQGEGYLFEFDNPEAIYYHHGEAMDFDREAIEVCGRTVFKSKLNLEEGDIVLVMSDGTVHAGIGMILNFGWPREKIKEYLNNHLTADHSARAAACVLASACNEIYEGMPSDDTTVAAVRIRRRLDVNVMVGPPVNKEQDEAHVARYLEGPGKKVVCGGTSSQILARHMGERLKTSLEFPDREIPPIGYIKGIDLVTEGVITLRRLLELSRKYISISDLTPKTYTQRDGASLLADILFEQSTHVHFFVGQSVNEAHQGLDIDITMKLKLVESIAANLRIMGKEVTLLYV